MKELVRTYIIVLSVATVLSAVILREISPEHYPSMLFTIPVFYAVMLGVMVLIRRAVEKKGKDRSLFFMAYRVAKIMLALVFILVFFMVTKADFMVFSIVFMSFYLCLSAVETVFFMKGEKKS